MQARSKGWEWASWQTGTGRPRPVQLGKGQCRGQARSTGLPRGLAAQSPPKPLLLVASDNTHRFPFPSGDWKSKKGFSETVIPSLFGTRDGFRGEQPLISRSAAWFLTGHSLVQVHGAGVGDSCSQGSRGESIFLPLGPCEHSGAHPNNPE